MSVIAGQHQSLRSHLEASQSPGVVRGSRAQILEGRSTSIERDKVHEPELDEEFDFEMPERRTYAGCILLLRGDEVYGLYP